MKKIGIIIFVIAVIIGITFANFFSWGKTSAKIFNFSINFGGVQGSGNFQTEKRNLAYFKAIEVSGAIEVEVIAQKDFSVEVEADDNLLQYIKTEINGNTLEIKTEKRFSSKNPIRVRISAPNIENLQGSGASKISLANLKNDSLRVDSSGASKIKVDGETKNLEVELSGASRFEAENLKTENATVDGSGASHASVFVSGDLKVDLSGASNVTYSGNPKNLEKSTSGASSIKGK
ncbi:MAG: head GIN domain-containing protein [Actinomycetota bacterium]